ncbi:MAG TPA: MBL fold metallo-hydrolase [Steroidobacteraceae bacterium]|jgi:glyoxylase-like metal-dependent hydrolase (beta-lactamase superfamily II)|nr:MBL fold metallo-hydrolase [Steroidobacteraceae bacterium]
MKKVTTILLTSALATAAMAQQTPPPAMPTPEDVKIETVNIAPGIYMLKGKGGNIGLTVGVDGAAIIDDQFDDMAPKIRAAVAMLSDQPVHFVINTHLHGDHTGGNDAFGKAGAVIIAQENVRKRLGTAQVNPSTNATIEARARVALPVVTFADTATLHFNDDDLEFTHLPNAHTETDIVVRFRRANVLHMGDTFTGGFPFIDGNTGGTLDGLILAHEAVLPTVDDNTKIIRGHGPLGNKAELQAYHDMLVVVRDRVARLVKAGKSQEAVVAARPTKEFEEKYGGTNFNAEQWIGRAYVDQKIALEKRRKK